VRVLVLVFVFILFVVGRGVWDLVNQLVFLTGSRMIKLT
jgi:hypothetical protein